MSVSEVANFKRNTTSMAVGTAISRVTGFGRTIALAWAIGASALAGTYQLANNVPTIIYELVVGGVLSATLVPVFSQYFASEQEDDAWAAVSAIFVTVISLIAILTLVVLTAAPVIIDAYTFLNHKPTASAQRETATYLLRLFAPQVAVYGFISVATGLLHARRRFAPPMFAPIVNNLVVISVLVAMPFVSKDLSLAAMQHDHAGLTFLGLGTTAGVLGMGLVLLPYVRKTSQGHLTLRSNFSHPAVKKVLRLSGWTIGFVIANQIAFWLTIALAGHDEADVAAFLIAYQFFILPHGVLSVSLMSALQPALADRWARQERAEFKSVMSTGIRVLILVILPTAFLMCVLAQPLMTLVLEHGRTTASAAHTIAWVVTLMAIGLPGFSAFLFFTRVLQAMLAARTVFYLYVLENGVNIVTVVPLYDALGVRGLGLSQSIAYAVGAVAAFLAIRRRAGRLGGRSLAGSVAKIATATAAMASSAGGVLWLLRDSVEIAQLAGAGALAALIFGGFIYLLAPDDLALLLRLPGRESVKGS